MKKIIFFVVGLLVISSLTTIVTPIGASGVKLENISKTFEKPAIIEKQDFDGILMDCHR